MCNFFMRKIFLGKKFISNKINHYVYFILCVTSMYQTAYMRIMNLKFMTYLDELSVIF